jgi:glycosyltransferase involved in cell wall biosynthesis
VIGVIEVAIGPIVASQPTTLFAARPVLSILLATVENRADLFAKLRAHLQAQAKGRSVELVIACDNKEISIGEKRQQLLERAAGDYVAFIDDDDWCSNDYIDRILHALERKPDCVGFEISCTFNGGESQKAVTSIRYPAWSDNQDGYRFVRSIYHKSVIRRDLALQVGFPDLRYAEDKIFSEGIMKLVKTEVFIPHVLYFYRFTREPFAKKYGFPAAQKSMKGVNYGHKRRPFQH